MHGAADFAKMVPGFDFLQNLMQGASGGLPQISQWIAPTLDPAELEKRIQDLKAVQFWLEQNTRLLGTTIQALEVQRMTLNTLKTMNLPLADLGAALRMPTPAAASTPVPPPAPTIPEPAPEPKATADVPKAAVDPMQWWSALTQQFTEIATQAMQDSQADTSRQAAGQLVQQSINAAQQSFQNALQQTTGGRKPLSSAAGAAEPPPSRATKAPSKAATQRTRAAAKKTAAATTSKRSRG